MSKCQDKKKRPFLAAYLSPLQAFLPVDIYLADSNVSTVTTVDQHPAAASYPWPILVGYPAQDHVSLCFVPIRASTVLLHSPRLASYTGIASNISNLATKYPHIVPGITFHNEETPA